MGIPVLILGESGSGKSTSMRNFEVDDLGIFNVASKPLPFRKKLPKMDRCGYAHIIYAIKKSNKKIFVIDDSQYLLSFDLFAKVKIKGYDKFTDMAVSFYNLIQFVINETAPDVIVYFLHHIETVDGKLKAKTVGKMLDEKLTVEGLFSIVLLCETRKTPEGIKHLFITQSDGNSTVKSPMDMLPDEMDNDLKAVDSAIRNYYEM